MIDAAKIQTGTEGNLVGLMINLSSMIDSIMDKYIDMMKSQGFFDLAGDDPQMKEMMEFFTETMNLIKYCEVIGVRWAENQNRMENKLDLITRKLDQDDLK